MPIASFHRSGHQKIYLTIEYTIATIDQDETIAKDEILSEEGREIVTVKATRGSKFVTGGGVGMMLMGSASVAVFARRFLTRARASY